MIIFANANGSIAAVSPSRITQGSVDANKIVLVGPFSNSVVTIAFTLPNGIVLGPNIAGLPEEYTTTEEYTMTELNDGNAVHTDLYAYSYTMNKALTSMSGTLGIQFFISTTRGTEENPDYTDTLATDKVNVPIYNGSRYIPELEVPSSSEELTRFLAAINAVIANTIKSDSNGNAQYIFSDVNIMKNPEGDSTEGEETEGEETGGNLGVDGDLDVGGSSNLGKYAEVVDDQGNPTVKFFGNLGKVDAKEVRATNADFEYAHPTNIYSDYASIDQADIPTLLVTLIKALGDTGLIQFTDDGNGKASMWVGPVSEITKSSTAQNTAIRVQNIIVDAIALIKDTLTVEKTLDVQGNAEVDGTLDVGGKLSALGDLDVGGKLTIKGNTVFEDQETLLVKDNIIVTNSSGASFSTSGLVIRLEEMDEVDGTSNAYGILYDPTADAVMIGSGVLSSTTNTEGVVSYEFNFTEGEALPLAARYGFSDTQDAVVPMWNGAKHAFSPSQIKFNGGEANIPSIATDRIYAALLRGTRVDTGSNNKTVEAGSGSYVVMGNGNEIQDGAQNACLIGENLKTRFSNQQIVGKFNFITHTLMWSCGNGRNEIERSNAFGTDYSGNFYISNEAYVYRRGRGVNGGATGSPTEAIRLLREDERVWNSEYAARESLEDIYMAIDWFPESNSLLGGLAVYGLRSPRQYVYKCYAQSGIEFYNNITVGNMSFNRFENIEFIFNGSSISKVFAIGFNGNSPIGTPVDITDVGYFSIQYNDTRYFY